MAASVEKWFCDELSKLGIDATEENAQYILSMEDAEDLQEYMLSLLDGSDPAVRAFIPRLMDRWYNTNGKRPADMKVLRKEDEPQDYVQGKSKKKRERNKHKETTSINSQGTMSAAVNGNSSATNTALHSLSVSSHTNEEKVYTEPCVPVRTDCLVDTTKSVMSNGHSTESPMVGQGAKKKNKFVPLYSQQGKERMVIKLPGRTQCECQASKHKLINNCTSCGRVVCEQEGEGPCLFCGKLVCNPENQEFLTHGSKKSEKLRQFLMKDVDKFTPLQEKCRERVLMPSTSVKMQEGLLNAQKQKDRLIEYDKTSVRRTQVIDDECDYFSTDSNQWLSKDDREKLRQREAELRNARHGSRKDRKITLDFAGRKVVEEENIVGKTMYDHRDTVVQEIQYCPSGEAGRGDNVASNSIVNPFIVQAAPKFVPDQNSTRKISSISAKTTNAVKPRAHVIQDRELNEMSDEGMCLSMHQPWAALLVAGVKVHEGRSWYTAHRGRLWIAATAKAPAKQEVEEMENHYRFLYKDPYIEFPTDYPAGCLLGCVDLVDCLSQEDYRQKFPDGESASPYVFICESPQELVIKFPIKGRHKIYKLDLAIHQAAKRGLR